jgi:hypothetical protein
MDLNLKPSVVTHILCCVCGTTINGGRKEVIAVTVGHIPGSPNASTSLWLQLIPLQEVIEGKGSVVCGVACAQTLTGKFVDTCLNVGVPA